MATHSSTLAWKIPWTEEPGGLQSMGSQKRHDLATKTNSHQLAGALVCSRNAEWNMRHGNCDVLRETRHL